MSGPAEPQGSEFAITPEEDRFLRAFFRRQALRYLVVLAALGALAVTGTVAALRAPREEPEPTAARPDPGTIAALEAFRAEERQLREDFEALGARLDKKKSAAAAERAALDDRIEAVLTRLERLEQRPAPEAAAQGATLERLERLEQRSARLEATLLGPGTGVHPSPQVEAAP